MCRLPWDDVREEGKDSKKWILVNLQDMSDFQCQALNRDIWRDEGIRQLLSENFIFLQYNTKDDVEADQYINFYLGGRRHENPDNYPHVSIVDPRTGEQVKVWAGRPFPSASDFHSQLAEFLDRYSLAENSRNPVVKAARRPKALDVDRMTEDEMLEMALQNSLATTNGHESSSKPDVIDPDSLTKSPTLPSREIPSLATTAAEAQPAATESSAFSKISRSNPHVEPANDPATTTRIQFRHATGRVIRRFSLQDRIERLYEWLKAEPLEGKEGVEFELKRMPQGQDLIEILDQTIEEAGLKQGTVMIEFVQD
jgi:hypothetical protein